MEILIAALSFGVLGVVFSAFCLYRQRRCNALLEFAEQQIVDLDEGISRMKELSEKNSQLLSQQSRRIAWLESRIRQPKLLKEDVLDETPAGEPARPTMTERRHHVTTLASRGQNADAIAAALGMMRGEVELIMNLNRSAAAAGR